MIQVIRRCGSVQTQICMFVDQLFSHLFFHSSLDPCLSLFLLFGVLSVSLYLLFMLLFISSSMCSCSLIVHLFFKVPRFLLFFFPLASIHRLLLRARPSQDLYGRHHAPLRTLNLPIILLECLPCPTDTTHCSHPPKTTSNSQRHQSPQPVSQAVSQPASKAASQPASLLLRLKITVVPVARLLSSSDTHQRSS